MLSQPPIDLPDGGVQFHGSSVAIDGKGLLIVGPSGVGKSQLALTLMSLGAVLVADDVTWVYAEPDLILTGPPTIAGQIEARGIGVLAAPPPIRTKVHAILDLGTAEANRLPPLRSIKILGHDVPLLHKPETVHVAAMILHYMRFGRAQ